MSNGVIFSLNTFFQGFIRHTPVLLFFYLHMKWNRIGKNAFVWPQSTIAHLGTFYSSRVKEVDTHRKKGLFFVVVGRWQESYACFNSFELLLDSWQECVWSIFYFPGGGDPVQVLMSFGVVFLWRLDKHAQGTDCVTAGIIFFRPPRLSLALGGRHLFSTK